MAGLTVDVVTVAYERGAAFALGVAYGPPEMLRRNRGSGETPTLEVFISLCEGFAGETGKGWDLCRVEEAPAESRLEAHHARTKREDVMRWQRCSDSRWEGVSVRRETVYGDGAQYVRNPQRRIDVSESVSVIGTGRAGGNKPANFRVPDGQIGGSGRRPVRGVSRPVLRQAVIYF